VQSTVLWPVLHGRPLYGRVVAGHRCVSAPTRRGAAARLLRRDRGVDVLESEPLRGMRSPVLREPAVRRGQLSVAL